MSRMAGIARTPRVKLTYDDFVRFPDDGMRHELIDGEHYVTPSPNTSHQRVVGQLHGLIWTYLRTRPAGELFTAPFDVVFSNVDVVEPDLLFVSKERASVLTQANVQGSPDLVVEVRSPSTGRRDETIKLSLYERAGVSEYWLVDPDAQAIRIHRRDGAGYGAATILTLMAGDVLTSRLFPDLEIPLSDIFHAAADIGTRPATGSC
jgi:Uma2 family endonuclease